MTFLEKWIEYDYNPFVVFNSQGKVLSVNREAQYLLGKVSNKELFDLALNYASETYGFKTFFVDLEFDKFEFFAVTVGYDTDDEIGIRLYKKPKNKVKNSNRSNRELSSVYVLIDLCISTNSSLSQAEFQKNFDPAIPDLMLCVDDFLKVLNRCFYAFNESSAINVRLYINIGEHVKIGERKYPILRIEISGDNFKNMRQEIETIATKSDYVIGFAHNTVMVDIPVITK